MKTRSRLMLGALVAVVFAAIAPNAFAAAKVRVLHGSPDVPAVTVYVNGNAAVPNLAPLASTDYLDLPAGTYKIQVALAGQPVSAAVLSADVTVEDGKRYTGFATGLLADGSVKLGVAEDIARAPFGSSSVRVWHNSPDAPAVDVLVNGNRVLSNVPYEARSEYLALPAGTYKVQVNVAGTNTAVFQGDVTTQPGESYTAIAQGSVTGKGEAFRVQILKDATSGSLVRVLHASPNVPAVSVFVNGQRAVARLGALKATGYLALDPGTYDIAVALAGQPLAKAVLKTKLTVADKTRYTALARGLLKGKGARKLELAAQRDIGTAPAGKSALRVWHLSPDAPRVDVFVNGKKAVSRLPYKRATAYLTLDPGTYNVEVRVAGTKTAVFKGKVTTAAGKAYSATALGSVAKNGLKFRVSVLADA
jgi:hypothetical protein